VLELEVVYLEQHLLSLYRKAFDQQLSSVSPTSKEESLKFPLTTLSARFINVSVPEILTKRECSATQSKDHELETQRKEQNRYEPETLGKEFNENLLEENHLDSSVYRCHSSLSHCPAFTRESPPAESLARSLRACHSQPLSMLEVNLKPCLNRVFNALNCQVKISISHELKLVYVLSCSVAIMK